MDFISSLGVFGWSLIALAVFSAAAFARKRLTGRGVRAAKVNLAKATLNTPPPVGGGVGGDL